MGAPDWILPDIPRIYTALAEWLACMTIIMEMKKRISGRMLAVVSAAALIFQSVFLAVTDGLEGPWWLLCMMAAVGFMYSFLYACCEISPKDAGYCCARAFVTAEFAASLEWEVYCFFLYDMGWTGIGAEIFWLVSIYGAVYLIIWALYHRLKEKEAGSVTTNRELISYIMIAAVVFLISNMGFVSVKTPFSGMYMPEIYNIRTMADLGGVAVMYAYHMQRVEYYVRHELESVQSILHQQYVQYRQSQEMIDLINYKYHDLKHHIFVLRAEEDAGKRNSYLDKMEAEIKAYEAQNKTGNQVLDTLLTAKNLYCIRNDIAMNSMVDGTLFDFMDVTDISSIFGNALDNAIECAEKIGEKEKRLIEVTASSKKGFLLIRFENYYEGDLEFSGNLPITTKKEAQFHGYGLKSLAATVHKYHGEVDISTESNWFILKILIPIV